MGFSENGDATSSMSGDFSDFDRDGDLDLLVPDMTYGSIYVNLDGGNFQDQSFSLGLAIPCGQYVSWDGRFFDYDNDGDLDIYISHGDAHRLDTMEDLLLANDPSGDNGGLCCRQRLPGGGMGTPINRLCSKGVAQWRADRHGRMVGGVVPSKRRSQCQLGVFPICQIERSI